MLMKLEKQAMANVVEQVEKMRLHETRTTQCGGRGRSRGRGRGRGSLEIPAQDHVG